VSDYRTLDDVTIEYFTQHPEEIDDFFDEIFADYAEDGDSASLLSALRILARVKGISNQLMMQPASEQTEKVINE